LGLAACGDGGGGGGGGGDTITNPQFTAQGDLSGTNNVFTFLRKGPNNYGCVIGYDFSSFDHGGKTHLRVSYSLQKIAATGTMKLTFKNGVNWANLMAGENAALSAATGGAYHESATNAAKVFEVPLSAVSSNRIVIQHNDGGNASHADNVEFKLTINSLTFYTP